MDETSLHIKAPPEQLYDLVSDLPAMGRLSPENTGAKWLKGATGPAVGARFRGSNKHGLARWWTHGVITKADRPRAVEWEVTESATRWGYRFEPDDDGTLVTEYRESIRRTHPVIRAVQRSGIIGRQREQLLVEGMATTLQRLKETAEARPNLPRP